MIHLQRQILWVWLAAATTAPPSLAATLTGQLLNDDHQAVAGVTVLVNEQRVKSDGRGQFRVTVEPAEHYVLRTDSRDWYPTHHVMAHDELAFAKNAAEFPAVFLVERKPGRVMLAFAGDTMMGRRYLKPLPGEPPLINRNNPLPDMKRILQWVKPYLSLADYASVNLETQLWEDTNPPTSLPKSVTFYTHSDIVQALQWAGVDYVALGNNHTFDYQGAGLANTLAALERHGMAFSGAGNRDTQARAPHAASINDQHFNFLSYVGWPGEFQPNQVANKNKGGAAYGSATDIQHDIQAAAQDHTVVAQVHAGLEYQNKPSLSERTLYHQMIDAGADLVLGHHSHVLQGFGLHKDKLIAYSLGNFVFDQYIYSTQLSLLLYVWMDGDEFHRAEIVPIYLNGYVPTPATRDLRFDILQRLMHLSDQSRLSFQPSGGHAQVSIRKQTLKAQALSVPVQSNKGIHPIQRFGANPVTNYSTYSGLTRPYRLGLDIIKRGSFSHAGEFDTVDRTWTGGNKIAIFTDGNPHLVAQGPVRVGLRTFERAFTPSTPSTIQATLTASGTATVTAWMQRRPNDQTREVALQHGPLVSLGAVKLKPNETVTTQFMGDLPRTNTRGIRLLLDIDQSEQDSVKIDDLIWIEWQTRWLDRDELVPSFERTQATHIEIQ